MTRNDSSRIPALHFSASDSGAGAAAPSDYWTAHLAHLGHAPQPDVVERHVTRYAWNYDRLLAMAPRHGVAVDIGCGAGEGVAYLVRAGFARVVGVDADAAPLAVANAFMVQHGKRFGTTKPEFTAADGGEFLKSIAGQAGCIMLNDMLEHVPEDAVVPFLKLCRAALLPGGVLLVKTPNLDCPLGVAFRYRDATHRTGFTATSLSQTLRLAGFRQFDFHREEAPLTSWRRTLRRKLLRGTAEALTRLAWFAMEMSPAPPVLSPWIIARATAHEEGGTTS